MGNEYEKIGLIIIYIIFFLNFSRLQCTLIPSSRIKIYNRLYHTMFDFHLPC